MLSIIHSIKICKVSKFVIFVTIHAELKIRGLFQKLIYLSQLSTTLFSEENNVAVSCILGIFGGSNLVFWSIIIFMMEKWHLNK
jgi:hypothetical protein